MKRFIFIFFMIASVTGKAQFIGGNSLSILVPSGEFSETHVVGVGFYGNIEYQFNKLALVGEVGWANWSAADELPLNTTVEIEDLYTWSVTAGLKYSLLGPLYLEGRTGYYFKDLDEFVIIPAIGLRIWKFDINAGMNVLSPTPFLNGRIGYYWAGN